MESRLLTPVQKLDALAMGLHVQDKFVFLMRRMLIVSTKPALVFSMALQQLRIFLFFGSDVSNAFAEAPPPKQGFYIRPDKAFHEWWTIHKKSPPIPPGHMIPILSAMQGCP